MKNDRIIIIGETITPCWIYKCEKCKRAFYEEKGKYNLEDVTCPTCKPVFIFSSQRMSSSIGACGDKAFASPNTCKMCGEEFNTLDSYARFCSGKCKKKFKKEEEKTPP